MSTTTEQRKLAAIMFTDMVGYTSLAQRDEALALTLLEEHRQLLRAQFPRFGGQEIKTLGDGFLLAFASALEAVRCAMEIQRALATRNGAAPARHRIDVRIGLHVGDVVHRDGDVLGDGVNLASRIESLASPGGICLTQQVLDQLGSQAGLRFVRLGQGDLKHVQVPVDVYRVVLPWVQTRYPLLGQLAFKLRQRRFRTWAAV